ncbi:MAG: methylenetetrahydrofolate reductase [NAD(P)H] [Gammaproteobacteria bacterium]|nr:methylenetetrahydrofolate reductase [NAD(P)H] [Pseudohongiella sp.]MAY55047.1 methylenetetrahydrofolate reductase [NAD(P)H] [Gammaproteobacteria bacterium]MBJ55688.1 methylenetetrahydrofolate reductase [NAD(P)H] [Gammaproteobacteria bacterium]HBN14245.1 methylenetetrahydrofolate reductase [NAD(P)H] [Pseudohongiella sp.]|tara:strand:- start:222 stop:1067 length:846 start_codon:yes stop_codon:yes gene_type:complete
MDIKNPDARFSFEFFPPRTDAGMEKLMIVHQELAALRPDFFSVTYGAGGSTRDGTRQAVTKISQAGSAVAPHLSFGGSSKEDILALLESYREMGINRLVALRGDIPSGTGAASQYFYANELIEFVREKTGDHFHIEVACYPEIHPQSDSYDSDIHFFKKKVDAGANSAITQYFYNPDAYFYFVDNCEKAGIEIPIVPGIMPITNFTSLQRFSVNCGAEIPRWIRQRLQSYGDDVESIRAFGAEVVLHLCEDLLAGGAPGLHFYSMNQTEPVRQIWQQLDLR